MRISDWSSDVGSSDRGGDQSQRHDRSGERTRRRRDQEAYRPLEGLGSDVGRRQSGRQYLRQGGKGNPEGQIARRSGADRLSRQRRSGAQRAQINQESVV